MAFCAGLKQYAAEMESLCVLLRCMRVEGQEALSLVDSRGIVYILVLNDAMEEIGRLSEASLIDGIAQLGMQATLYAILKLH